MANDVKMGRPTSLTPELGIEICDRLIRVGSLRTVCEDSDMPNKATVFRWLLKAEGENAEQIHKDFSDQYIRAREHSKDFKFDELQHELKEIAEIPMYDANGMPVLDNDGNQAKAMTTQSVGFAKLTFDAFKWQSSKENPKKYGDRVEHDVGGNLVINLTDKDSQA